MHTISGIAMDRRISAPRWRRGSRLAPWLLLPLALGGLMFWIAQRAPQLQRVDAPQLATAQRGEFRDELPLRARAEPLRSVQLDATEAGRVEAVLAQDGDAVKAGAPLYRLWSPDQEQLLMQRSSEVAQQLANVSVQRSAQAASLGANRRELAQLRAAQTQAEIDARRAGQLAREGFVSPAALDEAQRRAALAAQLAVQAAEDQRIEAQTRQQSLDEMDRAVQGLQRGLQLLERSRERLLAKAPMDGRLSGFALQVGTSVRAGDRLGRIDDPQGGVQLAADVDEFYLPRLQTGLMATSPQGELRLAQTLPQVLAGKVRVLLRWVGASPASLRAGQSVELRLRWSEPTPALLLPDGPGVQERLYVRQGDQLVQRHVVLGRRAAGQVEVLSGLSAGEQVLISQPPSSDAERLALP